MNGREGRSVGDLLLECDLSARHLLLDTEMLDSAAMLRVWPELVQAGHELLNALPGSEPEAIPGVSIRPDHVDPLGERLHLMATALNDNLRRRAWPGDGPVDDRLLAIAGHLVRAHDLIERRLRATGQPSSSSMADAAAARTRVLHTLYVTAHAVSLATRTETRDLQAGNHTARSRWASTKLAALRLAAARIDRFEELAGAEVYRSFPAALDGQQRATTAPDRLRDAVAMWEVESHRALVSDPSLGNMVELTRVQSATIALSHLLLQGAADAGVIDALAYRTGLAPRLAEAASAWSDLHATVRDLTTAGNRNVARNLRVAGSELVQALTELALDGRSIANPATLTERVRSSDVPGTLVRALATHTDAARILLDAALDPRTRLDARAAQRVITGLATSPQTSSPHEPWVSPRDIAIGRGVPIPPPVRGALLREISAVERASVTVATAVAGLDNTALVAPSEAETANENGPARVFHPAVAAPQTGTHGVTR